MTDLKNLTVSLTKHGAHKVAALLQSFPKDQVLNNVDGSYRGIKIARSQAIKNLSADSNGVLPDFWDEARQLDDTEVENLVFVAIVFSHHQLIDAMMQSGTGRMQGKLVRGRPVSGKAYTNTARIIDQLGFSVQQVYEHVIYDLRRLFTNDDFPILVAPLLATKLKVAGWDGSRKLVDECITQGFPRVFSISDDEFADWLKGRPPDPFSVLDFEPIDEKEFGQFHFKSGHVPRAKRATRTESRQAPKTAFLLHNELQTRLYEHLVEVYGEKSVGTELTGGYGSVDVVLFSGEKLTFFELKTETSLRSCIRHALPQLLEYAYWPDEKRASDLIIVSPNPITNQARRYMAYLRSEFRIPIHYQQFHLDKAELGESI